MSFPANLFPFSVSSLYLLNILSIIPLYTSHAPFCPSSFHDIHFCPFFHFSPFLLSILSCPSSSDSMHLTTEPFLSVLFFVHSHSFPSFFSHFLPQVAALQEEKSSLLAENQVLMERLNQSDSIEDINSPAGRRHLQLQTQLEQLQEETFRCEVARRRNILSC